MIICKRIKLIRIKQQEVISMAKFDVDFAHVRQNADIVAVLAHYEIGVDGEGEQRKGRCPFHDGTKSSLNVNTAKNLFKCHGCGCGGNVIKLVQLLDDKMENPRRAALQIASLSGIAAKPNEAVATPTEPEPIEATVAAEEVTGLTPEASDGIQENRPLTFELKLSPVTAGEAGVVGEFMETNGLPHARLQELGIGIGSRGSMKNRLAIPIRNKDDEIVAYCGRDVGLLDEADEPKYKFPPKFRKDFELYGWNEAQNFERVVLVQSFLSVIKHGGLAAAIGDAGFGVASPMGTCIYDRQVELLVETRPQVVVCFAGDDASHIGATQVATQLAHAGLWVTVRNCANGTKPQQMDSDEFCQLCGSDL
jgi:DNA primase